MQSELLLRLSLIYFICLWCSLSSILTICVFITVWILFSIINIFYSTIGTHDYLCMKGVTHGEEPAENDHLTLLFPSPL